MDSGSCRRTGVTTFYEAIFFHSSTVMAVAKQNFFTKLGFTTDAWQDLAKALLRHADDNKVAKTEDSPFGTRYIIEGEILAPKGKIATIRSVWFLETGKHIPRFVTSYPLQRRA